MADVKLSALTELAATAATGDEVYIRDISEAAADESKRITVANLVSGQSGVAKLWGHIDRSGGTPSLSSPSLNISSVTDNGAGQSLVNAGTDFSSAIYSAQGMATIPAASATGDIVNVEALAAGSFAVEVRDNSATLLDTTDKMVVAFGEQ